ncbi:hypothetical protein IFO70_30565 [Phormidium tenue FACHB-886]|nr:hypothetical protein [Phormidium tenue FACHB-886]
MVTRGFVEYDAIAKTYMLPAEHAAFLTRAVVSDNIAVKARRLAIVAMDPARRPLKASLKKPKLVSPATVTPEFEPIIVKKGQTRFDGFGDKILSLYLGA